ncbi:MAG TPA: efflux RND transporter periplasmic adaptor subunit [Casimicrobiaceae bacterium]|jgi:membrane fusion protein (multidrug efflux system)|nr:efflux RND transporter periplasmic adaptor subunit [Casimicrobiaceae bacterium]
MSKAVVVGAVVGVLIAAAAGYWFGQQHVRQPAATPTANRGGAPAPVAAVTVEAIKVARLSMPQTITTVGSLRSDESVVLRPEVAGRISAIQFREGQPVTKGAVLIRLDPVVNDAEVQQARANMTLARSKYDRSVDLAKQNFISSQAKDEAENNLKVAEAALSLAEAHLAKTTIRAPFSGVLGLRVVSVGDYVKEGADMVNIESIDPLKVDFRVPETYFRQVQTGQALSISLDSFPGKLYQGRVIAVNPLLDTAGRSVVIRAQVDNTDARLRPGMFARVRLVTRDVQDAMAIPEQAIVPEGDEQYVFRVMDGKAVRTKVETGQRRDAKVEIVKGLGIDDVVVVAGQIKLRDGTPVNILRRDSPMQAAKADPGAREADSAPPKPGPDTPPPRS